MSDQKTDWTKPSPQEKQLKYRLHYLLRQLTFNEYQIAMKFFPEKLMISNTTWKRWIYMREFEHTQMPAAAAFVFCNFFGIQPHEIFSTTPKTFSRNDLYHFSAN